MDMHPKQIILLAIVALLGIWIGGVLRRRLTKKGNENSNKK